MLPIPAPKVHPYVVFFSNLLKLIRGRHPDDQWSTLLSVARVEAARRLLSMRQARNEAIDLADCLQLCDKRDVVLRTPELMETLGFTSKSAATGLFRKIEALRDRLAHAQDIVAGSSWPEVINLVDDLDDLLCRIARARE